MNTKIHEFGFTEAALNEVRDARHCKNWPVAYLLNNKHEIYIGETTDMSRRAWQHFQNPERRRLKEMRVIDDDTFNKSAIQDLEAFLIENIAADGKFILQNGNRGLRQHNYFQRKNIRTALKIFGNNFSQLALQSIHYKQLKIRICLNTLPIKVSAMTKKELWIPFCQIYTKISEAKKTRHISSAVAPEQENQCLPSTS